MAQQLDVNVVSSILLNNGLAAATVIATPKIVPWRRDHIGVGPDRWYITEDGYGWIPQEETRVVRFDTDKDDSPLRRERLDLILSV